MRSAFMCVSVRHCCARMVRPTSRATVASVACGVSQSTCSTTSSLTKRTSPGGGTAMSRGGPAGCGAAGGGAGLGSTLTCGGSETSVSPPVRLAMTCGCAGGLLGGAGGSTTFGIVLAGCQGKNGKLGSGRMVHTLGSKPGGSPEASCWLVRPVPPALVCRPEVCVSQYELVTVPSDCATRPPSVLPAP